MTIRSQRHSAGSTTAVGFLCAASRRVIEHRGLATLLAVLVVAALCLGQWWLAYLQAQDWETSHSGQPVPFRLFSTIGRMLIIGAVGWLGLWTLSGRQDKIPSTSGNADWWRFDLRERQRIFEGRPMSRTLLWIHGLFGLVGFVLGVALALRLSASVGWQDQLLSRGKGRLGLVVLAIILTAFALRRIREVLFLQDFDYFVGDRAPEFARELAKEEQAVAEAEREDERKTMNGWPYMVFVVGFAGGMFLAHRWLPDADGNTAVQGSFSGFIASAAAVYLLKMKPRGWQGWLGVALAWAGGFLIFTHAMWHRSPLYLLLGTLWGTGVGVAATLLYLRKLRGK